MAGILNIQFKPVLENKTLNLKRVEKFIEENSDKNLDLVVMPEFFSTGIHHESFINSPENESGAETIAYLSELAQKYRINIVCGTVIEKSGENLYNTSFVLNRNGEIVAKYRKIHLYNYMGGKEGEIITSGNQFVTVDLDFAKIGLAICFDIRYPQQFKKLAQEGVQIIVLPTAWIIPNEIYENTDSKQFAADMWVSLQRTRAFDNLVYFVSSNQVGMVNSNMSALGNSMIISPTTEVLANAKDEECALFVDIDLDIVKYYKSVYPIASID